MSLIIDDSAVKRIQETHDRQNRQRWNLR